MPLFLKQFILSFQIKRMDRFIGIERAIGEIIRDCVPPCAKLPLAIDRADPMIKDHAAR